LDEVQAAILRVKLPHLESWIAARRAAAGRYTAAFAGSDLQVPVEPADARHVYHQYTLRVPERDRIQPELKAAGVETMVYYPVPLHLQQVHAKLGLREGSFPESERAAREVLSIPMYPEITADLQQHVVDAVFAACRREAVA
jgi:dTDP-4-amino-4,6-dideoxygalactose transaminase